MKTFKEGDLVKIINRKREFFGMQIHKRINPKILYRVLGVANTHCNGCTGHQQLIKICMKNTVSWISAMWVDFAIPEFEHTPQCIQDQKEYFSNFSY